MTNLSSLTDDDLYRIDSLSAAATPGPWTSSIEGRDHTSGDTFIQTGGDDLYLPPGAAAADHDFIARMRQDVPRLVTVLRQPSLEVSEGDLEKISQLCDAATPGPWTVATRLGQRVLQIRGKDFEINGASDADLDFIASLREDVPKLLRAIRTRQG